MTYNNYINKSYLSYGSCRVYNKGWETVSLLNRKIFIFGFFYFILFIISCEQCLASNYTFRGKHYYIYNGMYAVWQVRQLCKARNQDMVKVNSQAELEYIVKIIKPNYGTLKYINNNDLNAILKTH